MLKFRQISLEHINVRSELYKNIWLFPILLLIPLIVLTSLRISGTSIGAYSLIYGEGLKDPNLVDGSPRAVRSDEWLVSTQMVIAQSKNNFNRINNNIGEGQDMSFMPDVPIKDWPAFFSPQNLVFFILPLENAFAFRWWLLDLLLIISVYFLVLEFFSKDKRLAILFSIMAGLSPMLLWWYSSGTILSITYAILAIIFTTRIFKASSAKIKLGYSLALSYVLICFELLLYPPFQISCAIVSLVFVLGWILENYGDRVKIKKLLASWPYFIVVVSVVAVFSVGFFITRRAAIHTITHTAYPGQRKIQSGKTDPLQYFTSFLSPNLQYDTKAISGYLGNQSEASSFIFIAPFLVLPSSYIIYIWRLKHKQILWGLILINSLILLLTVRMYIYSPLLNLLYRLLLLDNVPNKRLLIGLGFAGLLQILLVIKALRSSIFKKKHALIMSLFASVSAFTVMLWVGLYTIETHPVFISSPFKVIVYSGWLAASIFLLFNKKFVVSIGMLTLFSVVSVYKIHPIYKGLGAVTNSPVIQAIESYPENGKWVVVGDRLLINFPIMSGRQSINSVQYYPQLELWNELDKSRQYDFIYNRYAHFVFSNDQSMKEPFRLKYADTVLVNFKPCDEFLQTNARYVLSDSKLNQKCLNPRSVVTLPQKQLYIYEIVKQ